MITPTLFYDYDHQAWVKDGVYKDCGHPQTGERYRDGTEPVWTWRTWQGCSCYGRLHAGERAPDSASAYLRLEVAARQAQR